MLIALAVLGVIVFVGADVIVPAYAGGFDAATLARTIELTRIMVLSPIFLALGAVATSVLNSRGRFAAAAVAPSVYNLAIIAAAIVLAPSMGAVGLAIGVVVGSLGHLLVQLPPLRAIGFHYQPLIDTGRRGRPEGPRAHGAAGDRAGGDADHLPRGDRAWPRALVSAP